MTLAALLLGTLAAWFPLTSYFFARDDFILMAAAAERGLFVVGEFFERGPWECFRPLTKGLYFVLMQRVFGLEPFPWHAASLLVHALNTALVPGVLRRLGAGPGGALAGAALFGFHTGFFSAVGWVSCIEVLMPMTFVLLALRWGLDALYGERRRDRILSLVAYGLALLGMEQAMGVPLFLAAAGLLGFASGGRAPRRLCHTLRTLAPCFGLLVAYLGLLLFLRRLPEHGAYSLQLGRNVLENVSAYLALSGEVLHRLTVRIERDELVLQASQGVPLALLAFALLRGERRLVLLSLIAFLAFYLPTLGLEDRASRHHTYIPSLWILLPAAFSVDEVLRLRLLRWLPGEGFTLLALYALAAGWMIRVNERASEGEPPRPRLHLLHMQRIAEHVFADIESLRDPGRSPREVSLIYREPGRHPAEARVISSIGMEHGLRVLYADADLVVHFRPKRRVLEREGDVFYFDASGRCSQERFPCYGERPASESAGG